MDDVCVGVIFLLGGRCLLRCLEVVGTSWGQSRGAVCSEEQRRLWSSCTDRQELHGLVFIFMVVMVSGPDVLRLSSFLIVSTPGTTPFTVFYGRSDAFLRSVKRRCHGINFCLSLSIHMFLLN